MAHAPSETLGQRKTKDQPKKIPLNLGSIHRMGNFTTISRNLNHNGDKLSAADGILDHDAKAGVSSKLGDWTISNPLFPSGTKVHVAGSAPLAILVISSPSIGTLPIPHSANVWLVICTAARGFSQSVYVCL